MSGLECDDEGASRPGEVCKDGYWRVIPDASDDAQRATDLGPVPDGAHDADASGEDGDCRLPSEREVCEERGMPCGAVSLPNPCSAGGMTVDCAQFIDFESDVDHCGGCDQGCEQPGEHAEASCEAGSCGIRCEEGYIDANGDFDDGCEEECSPTNGGVEICDEKDNDCDGQTDEDAADAQIYYRDADGDGFGSSDETSTGCEMPDGYTTNADDCDDSDGNAHPDADEICDGTIDDNCDGSVDENCPCTNGDTNACGTDVGACQKGTQTCTDGQWETECRGEVGPESEICDGIDNNCDGNVDEDFSDKGDACTAGVGACEQSGVIVCTADGSGTECDATPSAPASNETCGDNIDDTCDGVADEGCPCDFNAVSDGVCGEATRDNSGTCAEPGDYEADESSCDGKDNDCDGVVDEFCPCDYGGTSDGVCGSASRDASGSCEEPDDYEASESSCDGLDNDCDGTVDEGLTVVRYPDADQDGYGEAAGAAQVCPSASGFVNDNTDCDDTDPWTHPTATEICDGKDNNCNGYEFDNRDTGFTEASTWCQTYHDNVNSLKCDNDGPNGELCCEYDGDPSNGCDFETICHNNVDEDGDGDLNCADSDCDGMYCDPGKVCQNGTCQSI